MKSLLNLLFVICFLPSASIQALPGSGKLTRFFLNKVVKTEVTEILTRTTAYQKQLFTTHFAKTQAGKSLDASGFHKTLNAFTDLSKVDTSLMSPDYLLTIKKLQLKYAEEFMQQFSDHYGARFYDDMITSDLTSWLQYSQLKNSLMDIEPKLDSNAVDVSILESHLKAIVDNAAVTFDVLALRP